MLKIHILISFCYCAYFLFCYEPVDYVTKNKMNRHTIYAVIDSDFNLVVWRFWLRLPTLMYINTAHNYVYYKAMYTQHRPLCQTKISVSVHNKKLHVSKQYFDRDGCRVRDYPAKALHVYYDCSIRIY